MAGRTLNVLINGANFAPAGKGQFQTCKEGFGGCCKTGLADREMV